MLSENLELGLQLVGLWNLILLGFFWTNGESLCFPEFLSEEESWLNL
jgi:hypothetical protein